MDESVGAAFMWPDSVACLGVRNKKLLGVVLYLSTWHICLIGGPSLGSAEGFWNVIQHYVRYLVCLCTNEYYLALFSKSLLFYSTLVEI